MWEWIMGRHVLFSRVQFQKFVPIHFINLKRKKNSIRSGNSTRNSLSLSAKSIYFVSKLNYRVVRSADVLTE